MTDKGSIFARNACVRQKLKALVPDRVSPAITKRVNNMARNMGWFQQIPRRCFTKVTVSVAVVLKTCRFAAYTIVVFQDPPFWGFASEGIA